MRICEEDKIARDITTYRRFRRCSRGRYGGLVDRIWLRHQADRPAGVRRHRSPQATSRAATMRERPIEAPSPNSDPRRRRAAPSGGSAPASSSRSGGSAALEGASAWFRASPAASSCRAARATRPRTCCLTARRLPTGRAMTGRPTSTSSPTAGWTSGPSDATARQKLQSDIRRFRSDFPIDEHDADQVRRRKVSTGPRTHSLDSLLVPRRMIALTAAPGRSVRSGWRLNHREHGCPPGSHRACGFARGLAAALRPRSPRCGGAAAISLPWCKTRSGR